MNVKKIGIGLAFFITLLVGMIIGYKVSDVKANQDTTLASGEEIIERTQASTEAEETTVAETETEETTVEETTEPAEEETTETETSGEEEDEEEEPEYFGDFDKDTLKSLNNQRESLYREADSYANTMAIAEVDEQIVALNQYNFKNKKVAFLGDSITLGYGGNVTGQEKFFGFDDYIQEMLGIDEIINIGEGGSTIGRYNDDSCFERRGKDDIPDDVDIIVVMGGINDYINGWENFGDMDHLDKEETYCGSVDTLFYTLHNRWNADVFIVTPYGLEIEKEAEEKGIEFEEFIDVQRSLHAYYQLQMSDVYGSGLLNTNIPEIKSKLSADGTHLNNDGYKVLGQHIAADLVTYYGNKQYN